MQHAARSAARALLLDASPLLTPGRRVSPPPAPVVLEEGDRISLVLSVAPLVEQFFTFRAGDPQDPELAGSDGDASWVGSAASNAAVFSPGAVHSGRCAAARQPGARRLLQMLQLHAVRPHCMHACIALAACRRRCCHSPSVCGAGSAIARTATSRYTTAEQSTLEDLRCQICLHTLRQCVALEPCGHNFCATCLSHHLGSQLQSGLQLSCPFRCGTAVRSAVAARSTTTRVTDCLAAEDSMLHADAAAALCCCCCTGALLLSAS